MEVSGAPTSTAMRTRVSTTVTSMHTVLIISTPITAFTPPRTVYVHSRRTVTMTHTHSGILRSSVSVAHMRNSLTEAPSIFEMKKNHAPVL